MPAKPAALSASKFRAHQANMGWTNAKAADRLHVCVSTIEKWRAGAVPIPGTAAALLLAIMRYEMAARG